MGVIRIQAGIDDSAVGPKPIETQPGRLFHEFREAAPDAVVIIDGDGVIVQVKSQTGKLFGYRREELLGRPLEVLRAARDVRLAETCRSSAVADSHEVRG